MSMPPTDTRSIEQFVRGTLGCQCPPAVFQSLAISHEQLPEPGTPYARLLVGDRLLIYVLDAERATQLPAAVTALATRGREERDAARLNRFRLVLAAAHPAPVLSDVQASFEDAPGHDDRAHLHVVATDELPRDLRSP